MDNLVNILFEKYLQKKMAHFYILTPHQNTGDTRQALMNFCFDLFEKMELDREKIEQGVYPDFLNVQCLEGQYKLEDFAPMFQFLSLKPFGNKGRFIIIQDAHKINTLIMNKLLKVLEEPLDGDHIFLLNHQNTKLLPTILSRAIKLSVQCENANERQGLQGENLKETFLLLAKEKLDDKTVLLIEQTLSGSSGSFHFIDGLKRKKEEVETIFACALGALAQHKGNYESMLLWPELEQKFRTQSQYHHNMTYILATLHSNILKSFN